MPRQPYYSPLTIKTYPYNTSAPEWLAPNVYRVGNTTTQLLSPEQKAANQYVRFLPDRSRSEQAYSDIGAQMAALMAANKPVTDDLKSKLSAFYSDAANYGPHGIMEGPPPAQPAVASPVNSTDGGMGGQDLIGQQRAEIMRLMNAPTGGRFVMSRGVPPGTRDAVRQMEYQMNSPAGQADRKLQFLSQLAELDKSQMELAQRQRGEAAESLDLRNMGGPALVSLLEATKGTPAAYSIQAELSRRMSRGGATAGGPTHQAPVQDRGVPPMESVMPLEELVKARQNVPNVASLIQQIGPNADPAEVAAYLLRQGVTREALEKYAKSPIGSAFRPRQSDPAHVFNPLRFLTGITREEEANQNALRRAAMERYLPAAFGSQRPMINPGR